MTVIGVDVGIQACGYVICKVNNLDVCLVKDGEITPSRKNSLPQKLNYIFDKLDTEVETFKPEAIIVETLYSHYRHPTTMGVLAQVRGIVALLSWRRNIGFFEYSTTRVRKSFLGKGNVDSLRVKKMAENMTGRKLCSPHAADAFSLVIAFSHEQKVKRVLQNSV